MLAASLSFGGWEGSMPCCVFARNALRPGVEVAWGAQGVADVESDVHSIRVVL